MASPEVSGQEKISVSQRVAKREAVDGVIILYLGLFEKWLYNKNLLKFKIQSCAEGVTSVGKPNWEIDVVSYTLKTPLEPETNENIELQKLYPMQVWQEKPLIGRARIRTSIRKGAKIKKLS